MSTVRRNPTGPLRYSDLIQYNEVVFWGKTTPPKIAKQDDDVTYTIKSFDRHDLVAFQQLGDSQLGWVIMERQDQQGDRMRLWPNDWYPGRKISIPTRDGLSARGIV